jgi:LysM repeat protein
MSRYRASFLIITLISIFVICGCAVRTYKVIKPRVDQEVSGNRGFLSGSTPTGEVTPKSTTRDTYVTEIEFGNPAKFKKMSQPQPSEETIVTREKPVLEEDFLAEESESIPETPTFKTYKVASGDTLQKISKQFYGTYRKWQKIYDANRDKLANPNRIKPGMTLNIPE